MLPMGWITIIVVGRTTIVLGIVLIAIVLSGELFSSVLDLLMFGRV